MIKLTSVQEAAFNAAGEAMAELPAFFMQRRANGLFGVFGYVGGDYTNRMVHGPDRDTAAGAVQAFLDKLAEEQAKPPVLAKPVEVRDAAMAIVDEYRTDPELDGVSKPALDELADRIASLPVKE